MRKRLAFAGLLALTAQPLLAHTVGVSRGEYRIAGSVVEADLVFARPELLSALPDLDRDRDGSVSPAEVAASHELLEEGIVRALEVRAASGPCQGALRGAELTEGDGLAARAVYRCGGETSGLTIRLGFLSSLSLGHRHLATVTGSDERAVRAVVYEGRPELSLVAPGEGFGRTASGVAWPLFRLGIQHILTGYDHLLFLLALVLVGGRLRSLLFVVTAFTMAHSITLALAAVGVWAPSPRIVEPAIALSIAYVGVENWFVRDAARRWLITFPFGLVHGFGFAGALWEVSLPSAQVPLALLSFNAGVEAGQVAVLVVVLPPVFWLAGRRWFAEQGIRAVSTAIAAAGFCWFVSRLA